MIFGYILIDLDMFSSIPLIWKHSAVSETSNESQKVTETSNECRRSHGALHPARSLVCSSADQAKGASPCKVGGLVEIPTAATQNSIQKPATSVDARMGRFTPRDHSFVAPPIKRRGPPPARSAVWLRFKQQQRQIKGIGTPLPVR